MAQQQEPVKRRLALKFIKPGMDSRAVIARFEAERQALALMDAGTTTEAYRVAQGNQTPQAHGPQSVGLHLHQGYPRGGFFFDDGMAAI